MQHSSNYLVEVSRFEPPATLQFVALRQRLSLTPALEIVNSYSLRRNETTVPDSGPE